MTAMERFANSIVVPVVVLDKAEDAVPTTNAMLAGGIDTMEITFRTACAPEAIKAVAENCPDVLVGAGTVLNLEQCKLALEMGAKFIVSPGFSEEVVGYCVEHGVAVAPGCVTPHRDHERHEIRPENGQVLPGQCLRRPEGHEESVRSLCGHEVPAHRRREQRQHQRVHRRPLHPRRGRQLGLPQGGHCRGQLGQDYPAVPGRPEGRQGRVKGAAQ